MIDDGVAFLTSRLEINPVLNDKDRFKSSLHIILQFRLTVTSNV